MSFLFKVRMEGGGIIHPPTATQLEIPPSDFLKTDANSLVPNQRKRVNFLNINKITCCSEVKSNSKIHMLYMRTAKKETQPTILAQITVDAFPFSVSVSYCFLRHLFEFVLFVQTPRGGR